MTFSTITNVFVSTNWPTFLTNFWKCIHQLRYSQSQTLRCWCMLLAPLSSQKQHVKLTTTSELSRTCADEGQKGPYFFGSLRVSRSIIVIFLVFKHSNHLRASDSSDLFLQYQPSWTPSSSSSHLLGIPNVRTKTHSEASLSLLWPTACQKASGLRLILTLINLSYFLWIPFHYLSMLFNLDLRF